MQELNPFCSLTYQLVFHARNVKNVLGNLSGLLKLMTLSFKFPVDFPQTSLLYEDWLRMDQLYLQQSNQSSNLQTRENFIFKGISF